MYCYLSIIVEFYLQKLLRLLIMWIKKALLFFSDVEFLRITTVSYAAGIII